MDQPAYSGWKDSFFSLPHGDTLELSYSCCLLLPSSAKSCLFSFVLNFDNETFVGLTCPFLLALKTGQAIPGPYRAWLACTEPKAETATLPLYLETQNSLRNYTGVKVFFSWPGPYPPAADGAPQAVVLPGNRRSRGESLPLGRPPPRTLIGCHSSLSLSLFF